MYVWQAPLYEAWIDFLVGVRDAVGRIDAEALPDHPRSGPLRSEPIVEIGERLMMKLAGVNGRREIRAYSGADFTRVEGFQTADGIEELADAGGGKLWGLRRDTGGRYQFFWEVERLNADGSPDETYLSDEATYAGILRGSYGGKLVFEWDYGNPTHSVPRPRFYVYSLSIGTPRVGDRIGKSIIIPDSYARGLSAAGRGGVILFPDFNLQYLSQSVEGVLDEDFQIPLAGPEVEVTGPGETLCVEIDVNGKILVGGTRRFLADGQPDPTWDQPRLSRGAAIKGFQGRRNGEIFVFGDFDRVDGEAFPGLVSLKQSGDVADGFRPNIDLRFTQELRERPDGEILVSSQRGVDDPVRDQPGLLALEENGIYLHKIPLISRKFANVYGYGQYRLIGFDLFPNGDVVSTLANLRQASDQPLSTVVFYLPAGELEGRSYLIRETKGFPRPIVIGDDRVVVWKVISTRTEGYFDSLDASLDRLNYLGKDNEGFFHFQNMRTQWGEMIRVHPDRGQDPDFQSLTLETKAFHRVAIGQNRKIIALSRAWNRYRWNSSLVRLQENGLVDPAFQIDVPDYKDALLNDVIAVGDHLWIAGEFAEIGGEERHGLALVDNSDAEGFSEWMAAVSYGPDDRALGADEDPDGDGSSNFEEYAAATDPFDGSDQAHPTSRGERTWEIPCNPDSPEVERRIEVSEDCQNWRFATENEIRVEKSPQVLRWTMKKGTRVRFSRVRLQVSE